MNTEVITTKEMLVALIIAIVLAVIIYILMRMLSKKTVSGIRKLIEKRRGDKDE